jgi:putative CocE/NonD family hydrolase
MHGGTNQTKTGDIDFGPDARIDLQATNRRWFDRHLKGLAPQGAEPAVRYFMLGANAWREAQSWPPDDAKETALYLRAEGIAGFAAPGADERFSEFNSDPGKPVPAVPTSRSGVSRAALWSPMDYADISSRKDVLTWTTAQLDKPIVFAGPLRADLWVEADTADADWVVRLFAVPPAGMALPIAHGIVRASFRNSAAQSLPITPSQRFAVTVDLGSAGASLPAGYRLRIVIAGSSFPMYDRNLHTAEGPFSTRSIRARQKVYHQRGLASKIVLPVLAK